MQVSEWKVRPTKIEVAATKMEWKQRASTRDKFGSGRDADFCQKRGSRWTMLYVLHLVISGDNADTDVEVSLSLTGRWTPPVLQLNLMREIASVSCIAPRRKGDRHTVKNDSLPPLLTVFYG